MPSPKPITKSSMLNQPQEAVNRRIVGRHAPAVQVLEAARAAIEQAGGAILTDLAAAPDFDYTQLDPDLATEQRTPKADMGPPPAQGVGYAGMPPHWRARYQTWLKHPNEPAPAVFHELYAATCELFLLEDAIRFQADVGPTRMGFMHLTLNEMSKLAATPAWAGRGALLLARAQALGRFLSRADQGWVAWWCAADTPAAVRDVALGLQALIGIPLEASQLALAVRDWELSSEPVRDSLALMRLDDLRDRLGGEPLQWALAQAGETATLRLPWRTAHRDLRILLPQPLLRPLLEPLLAEAFAAPPISHLGNLTSAGAAPPNEADAAGAPAAPPNAAPPNAAVPIAAGAKHRKQGDYSLVLEFGHSRSEFYEFAVEIAQRQSTYVALLDENRRLVHRVVLGRTQMRTFWRLWDYVQNWTDTHVYVNGVLLEKWKIWPWSHYLQAE